MERLTEEEIETFFDNNAIEDFDLCAFVKKRKVELSIDESYKGDGVVAVVKILYDQEL